MIDCLTILNQFQLCEGAEKERTSGYVKVNLFPTRFSSESVTVVTDSDYELPPFLKPAQMNPLARC